MRQLGTRCRIESQRQTGGFGPSVTHGWATQPRWGGSAAIVTRRTLGQNNSLSPSPALFGYVLFIFVYVYYEYTTNKPSLRNINLKIGIMVKASGRQLKNSISNIDTRLTKPLTAIDKLLVIRKSDLTDKMKRSFFQAAVVSIQLYGCTTRTLTKRLEKKLDGNYTRMLRAILNKSRWQRPTRHKLYGHLPLIAKTIQLRRTRHAGHCWRSKDELISDVLLWTPTYGRAKARRPARTYIQQLYEDTGCSPKNLQKAKNDKEK